MRTGYILPVVLAAVGAVGPAVADPMTFALNGAVATTYDGNLFRLSPMEKRSERPRSVDDVITVPRAAFDLRLPLGRQVMTVAGGAGYRLHRSNRYLDSFDYSIHGRLAYRLPIACGGVLRVGQDQRLSSYEDFLQEPRRVLVRDRVAGGDITCGVTPDIALAGSAEVQDHRNFDEILSALNLEQTTLRAELAYGLPETLQTYAAVRFRRRAQPNFLASGLVGGSKANIWEAGGGIRWTPSEYLVLNAAGYWTQLRENRGVRNSSLFSGELTADWEVTGKTSLHLTVDTGINVSPNIGAIAYKTAGIAMRAVWAATANVRVELDLGYRRRAVARDLDVTGDDPLIRSERDNSWRGDVRIDYDITDGLTARAAVGIRDRTAFFEDLRFTATVATIGLTYRFSAPALDVPIE